MSIAQHRTLQKEELNIRNRDKSLSNLQTLQQSSLQFVKSLTGALTSLLGISDPDF